MFITARKGLWFDKDSDTGGGGTTDDGKETKDESKKDEKETKLTFDAFIESQSEEIKKLYSENVSGLKSALDIERKTNKESAKALKRLEELEAAETKRKEAEMSELEKAQTLAAEAQREKEDALSQLTTERVKNAVMGAATRLGFADPQDAYDLSDISEIEIGEDGKVSGVDEMLKKLSEAKPYLLSKNGKGGLGTPADRTKRQQQNKDETDKPKKPLFQF